MNWLKDVIVDIIATLLIILMVVSNQYFLEVIILGYTVLLLAVKFVVVVGNDFMRVISNAKSDAPEWFGHLLYGINTLVLLSFQWWYTGVAWAIIWLLSYLTQQKIKAKAHA